MARRRVAIASSRPEGVPACDVCLRATPVAKRTERGLRYCAACYKRCFSHRTCVACDRGCMVLATDPTPTCRPCRDRGRLCLRCGKDVPRAGRILPGGVVCPSCAYHSAPTRDCPSCGRAAPRLSRVGGEGDAVCDRCRRARECVTCARCRRHRRPEERDDAGRPLCGPCAAGVAHRCPDCGTDVPGGGGARCRPCAARHRGRSRAVERRRDIVEPWAAVLFDGFCEAVLLGPSPHGAVARQVDRAAAFFAAVGRGFTSSSDIGGTRLRVLLGAEGLRRAETEAAYLCRVIGFRWDDGPESAPVAAKLERGEPRSPVDPLARLLADYQRHLASARGDRPLATRTKVAYLRAARTLLAHAEREGRPAPTSRDVRRTLWRIPGARASLGPFLTWLEAEHGLTLVMPRRARRSRRAVEGWLLASAASLTAALEASTRPRAGFALLAACASRLFGLPLERVLEVRWEDVRRDGGLSLRIDDLWVEPPVRFIAQFDRIAGTKKCGFVFPGRSGQRPLSPGAVLHHVGKVPDGSRPGYGLPGGRRDCRASTDRVRQTTSRFNPNGVVIVDPDL